MPFQAKSALLKGKKAKTESDFTKHQNNLEVQDILNRYLQTNCKRFQMFSLYVKKGSGIRKYKTAKKKTHTRFSGSAYGNLSVDVPKLKK